MTLCVFAVPEGGVICSMNNIVLRDPILLYILRVGFVLKPEVRVCFKKLRLAIVSLIFV